MNIIGDIAGRYDELMELVSIMPEDEILLLGDLMDRGPKSRQVIEWAMETPNVKALYGNHEDLMVDFIENIGKGTTRYGSSIWFLNGGGLTLESYGAKVGMRLSEAASLVPKEHIEWLKSLPVYLKTDDLFASHAPWSKLHSWDAVNDMNDFDASLIWNRYEPIERDQFQVFGHNSHWGIRWLGDKDNPWAVCLDDSRNEVLTGMHWPSKEIFQVKYLDNKSAKNQESEL